MKTEEVMENMFYQGGALPPMLIEKAEGVYMYDSTGRRIIDATGGPMVVNIGYGRKEIPKVAEQLYNKIGYVMPVFASEPRIELTKRIKKFMPDELNRVLFTSGGSEAVEASIKFARQYQVVSGKASKFKVISRKSSYHGNTLGTLSVGGIDSRRKDFLPLLLDTPHIEACYCYRCPFDKTYPGCDVACARQLEETILKEGPDTVAMFIAEPIVGSAIGAPVPPPEYFPIIRETCDKYDVLFIADEVITGFGRTGKRMCMEHFDVIPDISVFAKGVSSGYAPLAGIAVREELVELFEEKQKEVSILFTFSAHPLSCAIGNEVLRIMEKEELIARAATMGEYLHKRLMQLDTLPMIGDIRGKGMLWGIEFVKDRETKEPFPADKNVTMEIISNCLMKGVFFYPGYYKDEMGRGDQIMIAPPFIITEAQIDQCIEILKEVLGELQDQFYGS